MITPDRYPIHHLSKGKSVVAKGIGWRLRCRYSLSRLSRRCIRTHLSARPSKNGATIIKFDLRQRDFQQELGATSTLSWRKEAYHVDIHELSTFHNPIQYRFILEPIPIGQIVYK
jgi:hypothetical protein